MDLRPPDLGRPAGVRRAALQDVLDAYRGALGTEAELRAAGARCRPGPRGNRSPAVAKLAPTGHRQLTALTLASEVVDWHRLATPTAFMGFPGLILSQYSSGPSTCLVSITLAGPEGVRIALVEAAWSYRFRPASARCCAAGMPERTRAPARSWKAQQRLHATWKKMTARGTPSGVAVTAMARELAGRLGRDDQLTSREASHQTGGVPGKRRRGRKDPRECSHEPTLAVSEGHRPAHSRPAIPTREYDLAVATATTTPRTPPHQPRPPPAPAGISRHPAGAPAGHGQARSRPGGSEPTGSRPL